MNEGKLRRWIDVHTWLTLTPPSLAISQLQRQCPCARPRPILSLKRVAPGLKPLTATRRFNPSRIELHNNRALRSGTLLADVVNHGRQILNTLGGFGSSHSGAGSASLPAGAPQIQKPGRVGLQASLHAPLPPPAQPLCAPRWPSPQSGRPRPGCELSARWPMDCQQR
jgi:hypothetical protein